MLDDKVIATAAHPLGWCIHINNTVTMGVLPMPTLLIALHPVGTALAAVGTRMLAVEVS